MASLITLGNVAQYKQTYAEMMASGDSDLVTAAAAIKTALDAYNAAELANGPFVSYEGQNIQSEGVEVVGSVAGIKAVDTLPPTTRTF